MIEYVFVLVGARACGKGTLAKIVAEHHGEKSFSFSTGVKFRDIAEDPMHEHHRVVTEQMPAGFYISDKISIEVFKLAFGSLNGELDSARFLFLDGVVRTSVQAEEIIPKVRKRFPKAKIITIEIETPRDVCLNRAMARAEEEDRSDDCESSFVTHWEQYSKHKDSLRSSMAEHCDELKIFPSREMRDKDAVPILRHIGLIPRKRAWEILRDTAYHENSLEEELYT